MYNNRARGRPKIIRDKIDKKNRGRPKKEIKEENYIYCTNIGNDNINSCFCNSTIIDGQKAFINPLNNDVFSSNGIYMGNIN